MGKGTKQDNLRFIRNTKEHRRLAHELIKRRLKENPSKLIEISDSRKKQIAAKFMIKNKNQEEVIRQQNNLCNPPIIYFINKITYKFTHKKEFYYLHMYKLF